jgi:DNA-binding response OmpR family regulator
MNGKKTVLLIDDDLQLVETAKKLLENAGFEVLTRNSGFDSTNFAARHNPDLVLLDINMPFLSGDRLFDIFQSHRAVKEIPVVFFSSNDENSLRKLVRETGALGYISKSEMGMSFAAKVAFYLERSQRSA